MPATAAAALDPEQVAQEIIVVHRAGLDAAERADLRADAQVALRRRVLRQGELVRVRRGSRAQALAELRADPDVLIAEPNRIVRRAADPLQPVQWALANEGPVSGPQLATPDADADFAEAWLWSRGAGVTVGVVDSGIDATHPDLATQTVPGRSFIGGGAPAEAVVDHDGHGTHVAGIIAAAENGIGGVGGAPQARVMPLQVLGGDGEGTVADVAEAFEYAGIAGLRVVNASLSAPVTSRTLDFVTGKYFTTLFVVAAGNEGADVDLPGVSVFPCESPSPNVLCVGASDWADRPASFSNRGAVSVDLHAPGTDIVSTWPGGVYMLWDGTSMAAPMVAAAAALLSAVNPEWPAARLKQALLGGADRLPAFAGASATGARLNAARPFELTTGGSAGLPAAPTGFAATGSLDRATLRWDPAASDIAGFRLYRVGADRAWQRLAETGDVTFQVDGLPPGPAEFALTAFDAYGNESPPAWATAHVTSPAVQQSPQSPQSAPPPQQQRPPVAGPQAGAVVTVGRLTRVGSRRWRPKGVRFVLSGSATVTATLRRKTSRGRYQVAARQRLRLAAGRRTLSVRNGRLLGRRLTRGTWKLTVAAPGNSASLRFSWR